MIDAAHAVIYAGTRFRMRAITRLQLQSCPALRRYSRSRRRGDHIEQWLRGTCGMLWRLRKRPIRSAYELTYEYGHALRATSITITLIQIDLHSGNHAPNNLFCRTEPQNAPHVGNGVHAPPCIALYGCSGRGQPL